MKVEYSSNNSGGHWWLSDKDWINLESNGWDVIWGELVFTYPCPECKKDSDELSLKEKYGGEKKYEYHVFKCEEHGIFELKDTNYTEKEKRGIIQPLLMLFCHKNQYVNSIIIPFYFRNIELYLWSW